MLDVFSFIVGTNQDMGFYISSETTQILEQ